MRKKVVALVFGALLLAGCGSTYYAAHPSEPGREGRHPASKCFTIQWHETHFFGNNNYWTVGTYCRKKVQP